MNYKVFFNFLLYFFFVQSIDAAQSYNIHRITQDSLGKTINLIYEQEQYRYVQKCLLVTGAATLIAGVLYAQGYFGCDQKYILKSGDTIVHADNTIQSAHNSSQAHHNLIMNFIDSCKNSFLYMMKNSATLIASLVKGVVLNLGAQKISLILKYYYDVTHLQGFIEHETQLHNLFKLTKEFSVPFDIYSDRLAMDLNFGQQRILLDDFIKEVVMILENQDDWSKNKFIALMKKDYMDKASSLKDLENFALESINYRKRVSLGLVDNPLDVQEMYKNLLQECCNKLMLDIEKILAFAHCKTRNSYMQVLCKEKIDNLINCTHRFIDQVEAKLQLPMNDLYAQSKQGDGLFDLICNFETIIKQHIHMLHYAIES